MFIYFCLHFQTGLRNPKNLHISVPEVSDDLLAPSGFKSLELSTQKIQLPEQLDVIKFLIFNIKIRQTRYHLSYDIIHLKITENSGRFGWLPRMEDSRIVLHLDKYLLRVTTFNCISSPKKTVQTLSNHFHMPRLWTSILCKSPNNVTMGSTSGWIYFLEITTDRFL